MAAETNAKKDENSNVVFIGDKPFKSFKFSA